MTDMVLWRQVRRAGSWAGGDGAKPRVAVLPQRVDCRAPAPPRVIDRGADRRVGAPEPVGDEAKFELGEPTPHGIWPLHSPPITAASLSWPSDQKSVCDTFASQGGFVGHCGIVAPLQSPRPMPA